MGLEVLVGVAGGTGVGADVEVLVGLGVFVLTAGVLVLATLAERAAARVRFTATVAPTAGVLTTAACV